MFDQNSKQIWVILVVIRSRRWVQGGEIPEEAAHNENCGSALSTALSEYVKTNDSLLKQEKR